MIDFPRRFGKYPAKIAENCPSRKKRFSIFLPVKATVGTFNYSSLEVTSKKKWKFSIKTIIFDTQSKTIIWEECVLAYHQNFLDFP